jgi:hypothetical protein
MEVAKILAYYDAATMTAVKKLIAQAPGRESFGAQREGIWDLNVNSKDEYRLVKTAPKHPFRRHSNETTFNKLKSSHKSFYFL